MPNQPTSTILHPFWHIQPSTAQSEDFWMVSSWVHRILMSKAPKWSKFPSHGMAEKSLNKPGIKKAAMLATVEKSPLYTYIYIVSDSHSTTYHQLPMGNPIDVRYFSCINPWYSDLKQLFKMILKMAISIHIIHMKTYYHCYSWSPITIIFTLGYTKWELNHIKAKSLDFPVKLCRTPLFKVQSCPQRFWGPLLPSCKLDSNRLRFSSSRRLNRSSALLRLISAWVVGTFAKLLVLEFGESFSGELWKLLDSPMSFK